MFDRIFANYLVDKQKLGPEALEKIFKLQDERRIRLGVIAVSEKMMSPETAEEINRLQKKTDKKFGDIALEKGYLTQNQINRLLVLQRNGFLSFVQTVVDLKLLNMGDIVDLLNDFQQEFGYTLTDMDNFKSCEADRIVPIYAYDTGNYASALIGVLVRTVTRLVDYHMYIEPPYRSDKFITENLCRQEVKGDFSILLAISGDDASIMSLGVGFGGKQFIKSMEEALDSICELINCINGIFAIQLSRQGIEMNNLPPLYKPGYGAINSEEIINIPMHVFDRVVTVSIVASDSFTVE